MNEKTSSISDPDFRLRPHRDLKSSSEKSSKEEEKSSKKKVLRTSQNLEFEYDDDEVDHYEIKDGKRIPIFKPDKRDH